VVCIHKAVERKRNTLEIKFPQKNVSYDCDFAKVIEKINNLVEVAKQHKIQSFSIVFSFFGY